MLKTFILCHGMIRGQILRLDHEIQKSFKKYQKYTPSNLESQSQNHSGLSAKGFVGLGEQQIHRERVYPFSVEKILSEMIICLSFIVSDSKSPGTFSLQILNGHPIHTLVADMKTDGDFRTYARFEKDNSKLCSTMGSSFKELIGDGVLVLAADLAHTGETYRSFVPIEKESLAENFEFFFQQSSQVPTKIQVYTQDNLKGCGGIFLQKMPGCSDDDWNTACLFLKTLTEQEFLKPDLSLETLLHFLFHELGVSILRALPIQSRCFCSLERVQQALKGLQNNGEDFNKDNHHPEIVCEFCGKIYKL